MNTSLERLDEITFTVINRLVMLYGIQYRHDIVADALLLQNKDTEGAVADGMRIVNETGTHLSSTFKSVLDDMIHEMKEGRNDA